VQNILSICLSKTVKIKIYKTIVLPVVLYGFETWSLTLRKEHRFMVSENWVLRIIFGPMRDEFSGDKKKLHNEDLHSLYSLPDIRMIKNERRWAAHVVRMEEMRHVLKMLVGKPEGNTPLVRSRLCWEDNIKTDLRDIDL
jgi:hypothetical protein